MKKIPIEVVKDLVTYNPEMPSGLMWTAKRGKGFEGRMAGVIRTKGYYYVCIKDTYYRAHRIVCALHGIDIDGFEVDHVDGNRANNKIENLRVVTSFQNNRNRGISIKNKSGFAGVQRVTYRSGSPAWRAHWKVGDKSRSRCFCVEKHGEWGAFALACMARKCAIENLNLGHTSRHIYGAQEAGL